MTEADWDSCTDPQAMLEFLRGRGAGSDRKLRLFAAACARRTWHLLEDERSRKALEAVEEFADGVVSRGRLIAARDEARNARYRFAVPAQFAAHRAACAVQDAARDTARSAALNATSEAARAMNPEDFNSCSPEELPRQAALLRDLFGPLPFRDVRIDPGWLAWNGGVVPKLARDVYDDRHLSEGGLECARLAVLADALEEAGCTNRDLLAHCRKGGEHVRGCWAVDLLLGKS